MDQIELNCVLMLNWIAWNRTVFYTKLKCLKYNLVCLKMDMVLITYNRWYAIKPTNQPNKQTNKQRYTHSLSSTLPSSLSLSLSLSGLSWVKYTKKCYWSNPVYTKPYVIVNHFFNSNYKIFKYQLEVVTFVNLSLTTSRVCEKENPFFILEKHPNA